MKLLLDQVRKQILKSKESPSSGMPRGVVYGFPGSPTTPEEAKGHLNTSQEGNQVYGSERIEGGN